jgi:hypothetical protein
MRLLVPELLELGEPEPVRVKVWLAVKLAKVVPDLLEVLNAEDVLVWLAEGAIDGLTVRVMVGGATHKLTESTSSIEGAWLSTALRTRNCSE